MIFDALFQTGVETWTIHILCSLVLLCVCFLTSVKSGIPKWHLKIEAFIAHFGKSCAKVGRFLHTSKFFVQKIAMPL
jgi:hypothetical protein